MNAVQLLMGLFLGSLAALAAWRAGALSPDGAIAAAALGTLVFGLGGGAWAGLLLAFFISSTLLSRLFRQKKAVAETHYAKSSRRDGVQVAANGGIAALFVLGQLLLPGATWPWIGFAAALAAVNADTWATELGGLSRSSPRLITSGRQVPAGTSGGVTALGTGAALAGAGFIAALAAWWSPHELTAGVWVLIGAAGVGGALLDSLLGATWQVMYHCPSCDSQTERLVHHCQTRTHYARGLTFLDNDRVNFLASLCAAGLAAMAAGLL